MLFDFATTTSRDRYKLLTALVVPRPIALVTSFSPTGVVNAAPYSFFNVFSQDPAICILGIERHSKERLKDTAANIETRNEFVVNLVDENLAEAMNVCAVDFAEDVSEIEAAGLSLEPSSKIETPRISQAPAALECTMHSTILLGEARRLVIGEIVGLFVQDALFDRETTRINTDIYQPIGRLSGSSYCRTHDQFAMIRKSVAEWNAEKSGG